MPGPLPNPQKRRRNAPTIATTALPFEGRKGRAPKLPKGYSLGEAGRAWWRWAWRLPQATRWDGGALYFVARRAVLEDDLNAVEGSGRSAVMREMRELDNRLGLNPKAMADLRWLIADPADSGASKERDQAEVSSLDDYRDRTG